MNRSPVIRINRLPANREDRTAHRRRLRESAFGAFRVVSAESQSQLLSALILARHDVGDYFNWETNKYTELLIPDRHGVTYVKRNDTLEALRSSGTKNFKFDTLEKGVANHNARAPEPVGIPLADLDWYGPGRMKLVAKIAIRGNGRHQNSDTRQDAVGVESGAEEMEPFEACFRDDASLLTKMLGRAGMPRQAVEVLEPDHLTICQFRRSRNGEHQLTDDQKYDIADIVQARFNQAQITAVTLAGELALHTMAEPKGLIPVLA